MTAYYSKVTKSDYVESAFRKVKKIHQSLPPGGILVFLTGKKEINYLCQRLKLELNRAQEASDSEDLEARTAEAKKAKAMKVLVLPLYS